MIDCEVLHTPNALESSYLNHHFLLYSLSFFRCNIILSGLLRFPKFLLHCPFPRVTGKLHVTCSVTFAREKLFGQMSETLATKRNNSNYQIRLNLFTFTGRPDMLTLEALPPVMIRRFTTI